MNDTLKEKKRGRPRKFTREQALVTAQTLFYQNGYDGLGIAQICSALNIPPTSLYSVFPSKKIFFLEVLNNYSDKFSSSFAKALIDAQDVASIFRIALEHTAHLYTENDNEVGCLMFSSVNVGGDPEIRDAINHKIAGLEQIIMSRFSQLRAENGQELSHVILTIMRGLSNAARSGESTENLLTTVEFLCMTFEG